VSRGLYYIQLPGFFPTREPNIVELRISKISVRGAGPPAPILLFTAAAKAKKLMLIFFCQNDEAIVSLPVLQIFATLAL